MAIKFTKVADYDVSASDILTGASVILKQGGTEQPAHTILEDEVFQRTGYYFYGESTTDEGQTWDYPKVLVVTSANASVLYDETTKTFTSTGVYLYSEGSTKVLSLETEDSGLLLNVKHPIWKEYLSYVINGTYDGSSYSLDRTFAEINGAYNDGLALSIVMKSTELGEIADIPLDFVGALDFAPMYEDPGYMFGKALGSQYFSLVILPNGEINVTVNNLKDKTFNFTYSNSTVTPGSGVTISSIVSAIIEGNLGKFRLTANNYSLYTSLINYSSVGNETVEAHFSKYDSSDQSITNYVLTGVKVNNVDTWSMAVRKIQTTA